MKTKILIATAVATLGLGCGALRAQGGLASAFNKVRLEARFDGEARAETEDSDAKYGFRGRYFDLVMGGDLGGGFSYYFRQNIRANSGNISFFDNTDFLWVNYQAGEHWRLRFGKDAMAVGGFEYDAAPIDEYMTSEYWNNIYCFQLGVSAAYTFGEGRQTIVAQVTQSPYINSRRDLGESLGWDAGLLAYNLQWIGKIGDHVNTLWSTSMIERARDKYRGTYMNLTMIGTQVVFDKWDLFLDLMHHAHAMDDWMNNGGWVLRFNYHFTPSWTIFFKNSHEENHSPAESGAAQWVDQMVPAGHSYTKTGLGFEYHPKGIESLRVHGYAALMSDLGGSGCTPDYSLCLNVGMSWKMDFLKLFK